MSIMLGAGNDMGDDLQFADRGRVVLGFDLDNMLLDPDMRAYRATVSGFLSTCDLGLTAEEAFTAYESTRAAGNALERIGLHNPIHERGHAEALAVFCMTCCANPGLGNELGIRASDREPYRAILVQLVSLEGATRSGSFESRLEGECRARTFSTRDDRVRRFCAEAQRIAKHRRIVEWANAYRSIELSQPVDNHLPLMETLVSKGMTPVLISEGRTDIQTEKLDRLGLRAFFRDRVLITEAAADVPGSAKLNEAVSKLIDARLSHRLRAGATGSDEAALSLLWYYRCLIESWSGKTLGSFGRCIHALQRAPQAPEKVLTRPIFVPHTAWKPLRFVMIGDRYDKDVQPLHELLGCDVGMKIRLRAGKYSHLDPEGALPADRRPDRTFTDWDSLASFLTDELEGENVQPIMTPPPLVRLADLRPDYIKQGLDSPHEAVRAVATAIAPMIEL